MKIPFLSALSLLLVCGPVVVAAPVQGEPVTVPTTGPFAPIPLSDPAYKSVQELLKAGITVLPPSTQTGSGQAGVSHYEFAVAVARVSCLLSPPGQKKSLADENREELEAKLQQSPDAATSLLSLINEFAPELKKLGLDMSVERQELLRSPFMHIPRNDPSYRSLGIIEDAELIHGYSVEIHLAGIPTREVEGTISTSGYLTPYQDAVAVIQAYPLPKSGTKANISVAEAAARRSHAEAIFRSHPEVIKALLKLADAFEPALTKLGQDVPAMQARLALLQTTSFSDVPKDHWAYQSVEVVRKAGIIVGYPGHDHSAEDTEKGTPL